MDNKNQEPEYQNNNIVSVLAGLLIGGVAGAVTMLLMAPQTGKATRKQIQEKGIELRDHTTEMLDDVVKQVRHDQKKIMMSGRQKVRELLKQVRHDQKKMTMGGRQKAKELLKQGQALASEQLDHVSDAAKAGKKAIQHA